MYTRITQLLLLFIVNIFFVTTPAQAQHNKFDDWVRICEDSGTFAGRCYISQRLTLKKTGKELFSLSIGYPLNNQLPLMLLSVPLGVYLPHGVVFAVDSLHKTKVVFAYCNTAGCHGYFRMTSGLIDDFREGRWLNVKFLDGTRKAHQFQVSLNGFTKAMQSLGAIKNSE